MITLNEGYYIEVETTERTYNFWLCRNGSRIKYQMFRTPKSDYKGIEDLKEYWKKYIEDPDFLATFKDSFCKAEEAIR